MPRAGADARNRAETGRRLPLHGRNDRPHDPRQRPHKFYQFWLNVSDADAEKYIKIFTTLSREEIEALVAQQAENPGLRPLQKRLALEITTMVHSAAEAEAAIEASQILFNPKAVEALHNLDEATLLDIMEGVPQFSVSRQAVIEGKTPLAELLTADSCPVFPSKGEFRKMVQGGGLSINKKKVTDPQAVATADMLLQDKYILAQRGKKNFFLLKAE